MYYSMQHFGERKYIVCSLIADITVCKIYARHSVKWIYVRHSVKWFNNNETVKFVTCYLKIPTLKNVKQY